MPGMAISYQVRRTGRRSKNISVRVHSDATVRVSAPSWASLKDIHRVVQLHAAWIADQVVQAQAIAPRYEDGALHYYLGKRYPLGLAAPQARGNVSFTGRRLLIETDDPSAATLRELLRRWYRAQAAALITDRMAVVCEGLPWLKASPTWRLRRMRSQWGSCTQAGEITLNTQLAKASLELIDYVVLHEVAHIKHHDHGRGFERLMDTHMADWRARRRDLNTLGTVILVD
jgi:predicted metal-dependent hydrolase